jgi:pimeloyl-ACP methyl ester carboxylesterase
MLKWLVGAILALVGLVAIVAVAGYFVLKRNDIPYETLAATYESAASRYAELPGGVRMHYRDEGNPNGPTLLLVHGFAASLHTWEPWVERLGDEYRIVSLDLPGHGLTRAPAGYQPSMEAYTEVVEAFAAAQNLTLFSIGGNSMGGHVSWSYALAHPERVQALILVDSAGWPEQTEGAGEGVEDGPLIFKLLQNPIVGPILRDLDNSQLTRQGLLSSFPARPDLVDDAMVARYVDLSRAPGHRDILLDLITNRAARSFATPERLAQLSAPTLIMHGTDDRLIPVANAQLFKDAISGADLALFEGVGHVPQEEIPDESAAAVRDFLYSVIEGPALATAAE